MAGSGAKDEGKAKESATPEGSPPVTDAAGAVVGAPEGADSETQVLSERGKVLLRLTDTAGNVGLAEFRMTLGTEDDAVPVVVGRAGLRVNREQADAIQASARAHGVELTEESV